MIGGEVALQAEVEKRDEIHVANGLLACGATWTPPDSRLWHNVNRTAPVHVLVFPRTAFGLAGRPGGPEVIHPGQVLLSRPGREYRRWLIDPRGEHNHWVWLAPDLLQELFGDVPGPDGDTPALPTSRQWFRVRRLLGEAEARGDETEAAWEAELIEVLSEIAEAFPGRARRSSSARALSRIPGRHRVDESGPTATSAVTDAIEFLARHLGERFELRRVAQAAGLSPSHLCVVFKSRTGVTLGDYLRRLRLLHSLDGLLEIGADLSGLAFDLGFSSHAHFSARFRSEFGVTPSAARTLLRDAGEA